MTCQNASTSISANKRSARSVNLPERGIYRVYKSRLSRVMAVYLADLPVLFMAMFSFTRSFQFVESERDCYEAAMFHSNKHVYPETNNDIHYFCFRVPLCHVAFVFFLFVVMFVLFGQINFVIILFGLGNLSNICIKSSILFHIHQV